MALLVYDPVLLGGAEQSVPRDLRGWLTRIAAYVAGRLNGEPDPLPDWDGR